MLQLAVISGTLECREGAVAALSYSADVGTSIAARHQRSTIAPLSPESYTLLLDTATHTALVGASHLLQAYSANTN